MSTAQLDKLIRLISDRGIAESTPYDEMHVTTDAQGRPTRIVLIEEGKELKEIIYTYGVNEYTIKANKLV